MSESTDGDVVIIISSALIEKVMLTYFNDVMFMLPVVINDSKPVDDGYAFTLSFESVQIAPLEDMDDDTYYSPGDALVNIVERAQELKDHTQANSETYKRVMRHIAQTRDSKGRFVRGGQE